MKRPLTQTGLKLIACLTMLLDHVGFALIHQPYGAYAALRIIGRLAFPIYCFLLTEGAAHTKSPAKYLLRLAVLAVLAEPFFDLMCCGQLTFQKQSVMVTLLLGCMMCCMMEKLPQYWMKLLLVIPFWAIAPLFRSDYGANGILLMAMFMLTRQLPMRLLWQVPLFGLLCIYMGGYAVRLPWRAVPIQWFAFAAIVPIALYGGQKGSTNKVLKWAMNLFYPVHMAIIVAIKLIFF